MKKIKLNLIQLFLLVSIPSIILSLISGSLLYSRLHNTGKVTTTNNKHVNEFINTYNKLLDEYYEDLDESKLVDAAINGMLSYTGDDYTIYMNEDATDALNDKLDGTYDGIGIRISINDNGEIYVYEVFDNSPSKEAGILVGDVIKSVNNKLVSGMSTDEVSKLIKDVKTDIPIVVIRDGNELTFNLSVKTLMVPAIKSSIKELNGKRVGYIYINAFSSTVDTQVESTLLSMEKDGIDSLIIDVRNNTGGYLRSCTNIVQMFLEKGKLMYTIKSKKDSTDYKDETDTKRNYPIVILINGSSASASEILAGSLKYSYGAKLIGNRSYGKGKVQSTGTLDDGTMIKYTSAKWYMPNGECIDKVGIEPDYNIELGEDYKNNPTEENDTQLNEALKLLTE